MAGKSKFNSLYQHIIMALAYSGKTDKEIVEYIEKDAVLNNITETTLNNWKKQFPSFFESLKEMKRFSDEKVEKSLYELSCGFTTIEEKYTTSLVYNKETGEDEEKIVLKERIVKQHAPSAVACFFWLKNRQKDKWRDRIDHAHSGKIENIVTDFKVSAKDLTKDQLADRIKYLVEDHRNGKN